ncbi:MAG TPA: DUF2934 domain-containing protein [Rhodanobacter sp.]|nr:DUF2934 domain-containing protein [Rhodanobacter sp.]
MIKRSSTSEITTAPESAPVPAAMRKTSVVKHSSPPSCTGHDPRVDAQTRRAMVAQAAYFRAQRRGFTGDGELNDWLEAEREISRMLEG